MEGARDPSCWVWAWRKRIITSCARRASRGAGGLSVCPDTHVERRPRVCAVGSSCSFALRLLRDLRITIPCGWWSSPAVSRHWHFSSCEKLAEPPGLFAWDLLVCIDSQPPPSLRTGLPSQPPTCTPTRDGQRCSQIEWSCVWKQSPGNWPPRGIFLQHRGRGEDEDCAPRDWQSTRQPAVRRQPEKQIHQEAKTGDAGFVTEIWPHISLLRELASGLARLLSSYLMLKLDVRTGSYERKIIPSGGKNKNIKNKLEPISMSWTPTQRH